MSSMNAFWVPIDAAARAQKARTVCAGRERQATMDIAGPARARIGQDCGRQYRFARNRFARNIARGLSTCEEVSPQHSRLPRGDWGFVPAAILVNMYAEAAGTARYAL